MTVLREGIVGGALNVFFIYKFLRILTTPFAETDAFKLGIIDEKGKILKKHKKLKTIEEKDSYTLMHRLVWKLKRLMEKIPFGKSRLASYAAAIWLIKEEKTFNGTDEELQESFLSFLETDWEDDARIIKEIYEADPDKKTFVNLREGLKDLPPHLQKLVKKIEKRQKDWNKQNPTAQVKTLVYNPKTGKPDIVVGEEAPPGWEGTIKAMKKKKGIDNPYKLAWWMHNQGMKPHIPEEFMGEDMQKVELTEALKPVDKSVIDAFYYKKERAAGKLLSTNGRSLEKHGIGGQTIAAWLKGKIAITAVSDVKSTESILKYMKKSIPKGMIDPKSYKKFFEHIGTKPHKHPHDEEEIDEKHGGFHWKKGMKLKGKKVKKLKDLRLYRGTPAKKSDQGHGFTKYSDTSQKMAFVGKSKRPKDFGYVGFGAELTGDQEISEADAAFPPTIKNLKMIVKDKQNQVFMFSKGKARVDLFTASALVAVYNALGSKMKKKFEEMIKTKEGFMKSADFAFKMAKEEVAPHAKVMAKKGDSPEKIKDMHPEITDDELENLFKEELDITTVTTFKSFLAEGRPALDPDYVPPRTQTDAMRAKLLSTQKRLYSAKDIESMARKYKLKLDGDPVGGKSWGGDWEIALKNGINLSYEYGPNSTYIKGWKLDRKAIKSYIEKYANEHETPRDYAPMGGKVLVGGFEAAFELISEAAAFHLYPKRNKVGDEIEKLANKGGSQSHNLFVIATALQKGRIPNKFIKNLSPEVKKEVHAIMKDFGWKTLPEELDEKFAGWIAFHPTKDEKLEIKPKKGVIDSLYDAKQAAIKHWKLPKSKHSLLAIEPAQEEVQEEAPANSVAGGNVNLDPFAKKKRKNAKVQTEMFGGQKVFVVSPERFFDSRLGKARYARYEKYVGNDKLGEAIRQYGRNNPKNSIILKNSGNGAMLYLKYGRK